MRELSDLTFWVNGKQHTVAAPSSPLPLVQYLRSSGLTGTKVSCGEGSCGSCTVLLGRVSGSGELEEVTVTSCSLQLDPGLQGAHVTTVEGLGSAKAGLHPVQERLHMGHGSQCGFCSPGMVMSMVGVLKQCPAPDIEDICSGLQVPFNHNLKKDRMNFSG